MKTNERNDHNENETNQNTSLDLEEIRGISTTLDHEIEAFATEVLGTNLFKHSAEYINRYEVGHITIFNFNGLKNYYAYSDKRYPENGIPKYYEHFTVFVLEYENEHSASNAFKSVYANSKLNSKQLDSIRINNHVLLALQ